MRKLLLFIFIFTSTFLLFFFLIAIHQANIPSAEAVNCVGTDTLCGPDCCNRLETCKPDPAAPPGGLALLICVLDSCANREENCGGTKLCCNTTLDRCIPGAPDGGTWCNNSTIAPTATPPIVPIIPECNIRNGCNPAVGPYEFGCNGTSCDTAIGTIGTTPEGFINGLFAKILGIVGGIAVLLIIISGYRLMASQGNPEKVQGAKEQLTAAIIGLLFVIFSLVILQVIGYDILRLPGFNP